MTEAYEIHDAQFIQQKLTTSAADALSMEVGPVPAGKIWTVLAAYGNCSVAETQDYWFAIQAGTRNFPVTRPVSFSVDPAVSKFFPMLTEGMEIKLFPGEYLKIFRGAATAGSTLTVACRFIETDMQFYVELDKHKVLRRRQEVMLSSEPIARGTPPARLGAPGGREARERPTRY